MKARDLLAVTGARRKPVKGRRDRVAVKPACQDWAKRHQVVLRRAFSRPDEDVDLTAGLADDELRALGGIPLRLVTGRVAWSCEADDRVMALRILGLASPPPVAETTVPELYELRPGTYVVVRRATDDPRAEPVFKGTRP